jgi:hypothetical protein
MKGYVTTPKRTIPGTQEGICFLSKNDYFREFRKGYRPYQIGLFKGIQEGICYLSKKIIPGIWDAFPILKGLCRGIQEGICSSSIKDYFGKFKKEYAPHQKGLF